MGTKPHLTLLHLSDPQFGRHHRFGRLGLPSPDDRFDALLARISDDLKGLEKDHGLKPDLMLVTGDLAEWGLKSEFSDALRFLEGLTELFKLPRERVVLIPGNHDVNRKACEAYFNSCEADEEEPESPFWPKWKHYDRLFHAFYRDVPGVTFTEEEPWSLFEIEDLKVVVAGLNSTMAESHRDDDHYGHVGEAQLRWFAEQLESYGDRKWLRIGAVHHNVLRKAVNDDENLRDADDLERLLEPHLNLILHGHTHSGRLGQLGEVPVLSTGSAALTAETLPGEVPNQYQYVRIWPNRIQRWWRAYAPDRKQWIGDTRASKKGDRWTAGHSVNLKGVMGTFRDNPALRIDTEEIKTRAWKIGYERRPQDDYLSRVEKVCSLKEGGCNEVEWIRSAAGTDYLRVSVGRDGLARCYPVGAIQGDVTRDGLDDFLKVHRRYQRTDPGVISILVYGGEPVSPELAREAEGQRVRLRSFVEYQGLLDCRFYVERQTAHLARDPLYPPSLYVPQRIGFASGEERREAEALPQVERWLADPYGRFVLILGDFGTGKTFLLHELARRLGESDGSLTPILIEMRDLEKGRSLDELVAQHLARSGMERIDLKAFRYMLREGRIALLFDGFDELALRVTYDRAAEHFQTLVEAASGEAKVVVTSRTTHFESERQIKTALGEKIELLPGRRIAHLRPFDEGQIRGFLVNRLGSEAEAEARFAVIDEVKDLLGLSHNPRMLSFIADLREEDLLAAKEQEGEITSAELYRLILERWLEHEYERQQPKGALPALTVDQRWDAVTQLALRLWQRMERALTISEMSEELADALEDLTAELSSGVATHQVGSGTLLVRDAEGGFRFIHQSVLEWLVARRAASELRETEGSEILGLRELSTLMADFVTGLSGRSEATAWAHRELAQGASEVAKTNALLLLGRIEDVGSDGVTVESEAPTKIVDLKGQDLRGRNLSGQDLRGADLENADLSSARLNGTDLRGAKLVGAKMRNAELQVALLDRADLRGADLTGARLLGADLRDARLDGATLRRAAMVRAVLTGATGEADLLGSAPPEPEGVKPWLSIASPCNSVVWDPRSEILATGHADGSVRLWGVDGHEIDRFLGHANEVLSVSFSPDGKSLASGSRDHTVRVWDAQTGKSHQRLADHAGGVYSVAFSPDGKFLASGSRDHTVRVWDAQMGETRQTFAGHTNWVHSVSFSPDGKSLASGSYDKTVRIWDVETGESRRALSGHVNGVHSVSFSPDGKSLASGSRDNTVRIWDVETGESRQTFSGHVNWVNSVSFSPDGKSLASGSRDKTVRIWDVETGESRRALSGHMNGVHSVSFSPDGKFLASGSRDKTVRVWDVETGEARRKLEGYSNGVLSVVFSPDGKFLASGSDDHAVRVWDAETGEAGRTLGGHSNWVLSVVFSPDGRSLASSSRDHTVTIWDAETGEARRTLGGHLDWVHSVSFSPDGKFLASGSDDHTVQIWDAKTGEARWTLRGHLDWVHSVAFSPGGKSLASGSRDRTVRVWDAETGEAGRTLGGHSNWVLSVVFSPDGKSLASGSRDHTVRIWDVETGEARRTLGGHLDWVYSVAFSPDGKSLASSSGDHTVRVWDAKTGEAWQMLEGHSRGVRSVAFSPDGKSLASASDDNTVRIWDVETGRCLVILGHLPEGWVAFTPEGRYKLGGEIAGGFWHSINLCRFEPGELDPYLPEPLRMPDDEPFF